MILLLLLLLVVLVLVQQKKYDLLEKVAVVAGVATVALFIIGAFIGVLNG